MIWKNDFKHVYIKRRNKSASPGLDAGYRMLGFMQLDDPEGCYGEGGKGVQDGEQAHSRQIHSDAYKTNAIL